MDTSQKLANRNDLAASRKPGSARFKVLGRKADRDLIRSLAVRLADDTPEASRLRDIVSQALAAEPQVKGGILAALRRSPLVGADLDTTRDATTGRTKIDLSLLDALTAKMPPHPQTAADLVRSMRDEDRY